MFNPTNSETFWEIANSIFQSSEEAIFYHTSLKKHNKTQSILAWEVEDQIISNTFSSLEKKLTADQDCYQNAWFGYFSYELCHDLENCIKTNLPPIPMPRLSWRKFKHHLIWDHHSEEVTYQGPNKKAIPIPKKFNRNKKYYTYNKPESLIQKEDYIQKIKALKADILAGDLLQSNLTRKVVGSFYKTPDPIPLFYQLCKNSPASYAALLKFSHGTIISSSPEQFLTVTDKGTVTTSPIKGTIHRSENKLKDKKLKEALRNSEKDQAENLMIVDLSRNDLSKTCKPGSISVSNLFDIQSYKTLHHMVSNISGIKQSHYSCLDVVKAAFPPGSMTGTPKIMAMQKAAQLETIERGVYSGALGWFGGNGQCDLSVVIRTLIIQGKAFEYQVGGAITIDSNPEKEWLETLTKEKGIQSILS